jgi:hypothetical protein
MTPPRIASWLLEASLPSLDGEAIAGDLHEEFATHIVPARGVFRARWWYRRQVARSLAPLYFRSWQRASIFRASVAIVCAGFTAVVPATLIVMVRTFVLQQVPLKTTAELSFAFAMLLVAVATVAAVFSVAVAVRVLAARRTERDRRH